MKFQAPRGTRDFFPADMAVRNWIEERWRAVSRRNGFAEYDGPIFEYLDLYRVKSGAEIVDQLFHFTGRGGDEYAIRPEMTPTLARMVASRAQTLPKPIKWFSVPRVCRAERPQRGRLREFFQWNIDILGEDGPIADAECVFVAVDFFREIGLSPGQVQIHINSRAVVAALLTQLQIPAGQLGDVYAVLDKRDKLSTEAFTEQLGKLGLNATQQSGLLEMGQAKGPEGLAWVTSRLADSADGAVPVATLGEVFALLRALGVAEYCRYDMGVVRGLAYYTGLVFEGFGTGGLKRAVCGGGRYDRLLSDVGGPPLGGVGFATSDVVAQDLLEEMGQLPACSAGLDVFVIDAAMEVFSVVLDLCARLRRQGLSTAFSYKRQSVGKQFKQAAALPARRVVIVEGDPAAGPRLTVKDLASGRQASLAVEEFLRNPLQDIA